MLKHPDRSPRRSRAPLGHALVLVVAGLFMTACAGGTQAPPLAAADAAAASQASKDGAPAAVARSAVPTGVPEPDSDVSATVRPEPLADPASRSAETGTPPVIEVDPSPGAPLTLAAVGDIQMGMAWPPKAVTLPDDGGASFFAGVQDVLQAADVTFGNLETVIADSGDSTKCGPTSTKCFAFRIPTSFAQHLPAAGFDVMSIANNHSGDFGDEGREATMRALEGVGLAYSGPVGKLATAERHGKKIGLVAFSTGGGLYRIQEVDEARRVVRELGKTHDLVIVSFHGGAEGTGAQRVPKGPEDFYGESRGDVYAFAHAVVDEGADLVLGHGPHVWRGMELYRGRLIAYSMGNFSGYNTLKLIGALAVSGILHVKLAPNGVALEVAVTPTVLEKPGLPVKDAKRQVIDLVRNLSKLDFGDPLLDENGRWVHRSLTPAVVGGL